MQQIEFRAMGCQMLTAIDSDAPASAERLAQVPGWFAGWEASLSRFRPESELNRLNASSGGPQRVSETLWEALQAALAAARQSDGLVTPMVLPALEAAGYTQSFDGGPWIAHTAVAPVPTVHDWRSITLDRRTRSVTLPPGTRLDLGGSAKGWAAAQAVRRLSIDGPALVDAGGDVAISGPRADGSPWAIGVADPRMVDGEVALLLLNRGGVATSGRDYRRWRQNGAWQHHIIDPRSARPAVTDVLSATVVAPTLAEAEAAAKVALILGCRDGLAWIEERPGLAALLVGEDGRVLQSARLGEYLWQANNSLM